MSEQEQVTAADEKPGVRVTMVITLKSGTQVRMGIESAEVTRSASTGKLREVKWTLDRDPLGNTIGYVDPDEVAAIHYEREAQRHVLPPHQDGCPALLDPLGPCACEPPERYGDE